MNVVLDNDVNAVLEFMYRNLPANKLVSVSRGVSDLATVLWKHNPQERFLAASIEMDHFQAICDSRQVSIV
jgi:hypothetical protein